MPWPELFHTAASRSRIKILIKAHKRTCLESCSNLPRLREELDRKVKAEKWGELEFFQQRGMLQFFCPHLCHCGVFNEISRYTFPSKLCCNFPSATLTSLLPGMWSFRCSTDRPSTTSWQAPSFSTR